MLKRPLVQFLLAVAIPIILFLSCQSLPFFPKQAGTPGEVEDEARLAKRTAASFPAADEDYFAGMIAEKASEVILADAKQRFA